MSTTNDKGTSLKTGGVTTKCFASHKLWMLRRIWILFQRATFKTFATSNHIIKVLIKKFMINGVHKKFVPFWIDAAEDIDNDPYTTDCSGATNEANPHAYSEVSIQNGAFNSAVCIKKSPGSIYGSYNIICHMLYVTCWNQHNYLFWSFLRVESVLKL